MRSEGLALMRAGITAQYSDTPVDEEPETGRAANRRAAYATALSSRSTYANRLSRPTRIVPTPRHTAEATSSDLSFAV
jgi:hypothetical protein